LTTQSNKVNTSGNRALLTSSLLSLSLFFTGFNFSLAKDRVKIILERSKF
jgi:hypothetical protein